MINFMSHTVLYAYTYNILKDNVAYFFLIITIEPYREKHKPIARDILFRVSRNMTLLLRYNSLLFKIKEQSSL